MKGMSARQLADAGEKCLLGMILNTLLQVLKRNDLVDGPVNAGMFQNLFDLRRKQEQRRDCKIIEGLYAEAVARTK